MEDMNSRGEKRVYEWAATYFLGGDVWRKRKKNLGDKSRCGRSA